MSLRDKIQALHDEHADDARGYGSYEDDPYFRGRDNARQDMHERFRDELASVLAEPDDSRIAALERLHDVDQARIDWLEQEVARLTGALQAESDSHQETVEIMRRIRDSRARLIANRSVR